MLCSSCLAVVLALAPSPASEPEWVDGPLEAVLARAQAEQKLVMVELTTPWSRDSARLHEVLASEALVEALAGFLCLALDAEGRDGAPIAYRERVSAYPTLLFLEPDGALRERLSGYQAAEDMAGELGRVARNEGTLAALRAALAGAPDDLELRYELARKLQAAGDAEGEQAELSEIRARDPEGRSLVSRRLRFDELRDDFYQDLVNWKEPDWAGFEALSLEVGDPALEFRGLALLAFGHNIEALRARNAIAEDPAKEAEVQPHLQASRAFYARAWAIVPEQNVAAFGNELAWAYWEDRDHLTAEERALALEVAERALALLPDESAITDTTACCNFMNGNRERALELNARARELRPEDAAQWDERDALFRGE